MRESWATLGVDLHLDLTGPRVREGLTRALREAVSGGRLAPGTRLPSSRALAHDLGVARNTVAEAYAQLVAEGWLTARQGSGTSVAARPLPAPSAAPPVTRPAEEAPPYDLRPGAPDLSDFPRTAWLAAARRALGAAPSDAFGYGDPRGRPELREALAGYLARARGVRADPEHLVVCSGFLHGLSLLCAALHAAGAATLAVEEYGVGYHRNAAAASGTRPVPVPVDGEGARTDLLTGDAALLTPAHQMPLGACLTPRRRAAAVAWARAAGAVVIEDDYDGEFRYDRQGPGALQGLDPGRVAYLGTASKSLAPGLRLAWMALPEHLVEPVVETRKLRDAHSSVTDQLTLAEFLRHGGYDRHLRRARLRYRRRRDRLVAELARRAPRARVTGVAAGLHVLVRLPDGADEAEVVRRAAARGLALYGLADFGFRPAPGAPPALVVGYGTPPEHAFAGALERLCEVLG
ncbi:PLP-dependent aminotransferase family protein [Streptomyces capparidis]